MRTLLIMAFTSTLIIAALYGLLSSRKKEQAPEVYTALMMGTGTAQVFTVEEINRFSGLKAFNSSPELSPSFLQEFLLKQKPQLLILSVDFDQSTEALKAIKEISDQHQIRLMVFTSPVTSAYLTKTKSLYKDALVEIFGEVWDFNNDGIRYFTPPEYFRSDRYPTQLLAALVLERIFTGELTDYPGFGVLLKKGDPKPTKPRAQVKIQIPVPPPLTEAQLLCMSAVGISYKKDYAKNLCADVTRLPHVRCIKSLTKEYRADYAKKVCAAIKTNKQAKCIEKLIKDRRADFVIAKCQ